MKIHFLKTVWSDIILLEDKGRFAMIDTGEKRQFPETKAYLDEHGVKKLDFILLTHFHCDHYGSIPLLLENYPVGKVYLKEYSGLDATTSSGKEADDGYRSAETAKYNAIAALAKQKSELCVIDGIDEVKFADHTLKLFRTQNTVRVMYEDSSCPDTYHRHAFSENQNSIALFAKINGVNVFFGGDIEDREAVHPLADYCNVRIAKAIGERIDLYKAPHHGTTGTASPEALAVYRPVHAVVTNGEKWFVKYDAENNLRNANPEVHLYLTENTGVVAEITCDGNLTVAGEERI